MRHCHHLISRGGAVDALAVRDEGLQEWWRPRSVRARPRKERRGRTRALPAAVPGDPFLRRRARMPRLIPIESQVFAPCSPHCLSTRRGACGRIGACPPRYGCPGISSVNVPAGARRLHGIAPSCARAWCGSTRWQIGTGAAKVTASGRDDSMTEIRAGAADATQALPVW